MLIEADSLMNEVRYDEAQAVLQSVIEPSSTSARWKWRPATRPPPYGTLTG